MAEELVVRDSTLSIIDKAVGNPQLDVDKLKALLDMKERWDAMEAKKAYVEAMRKFKENPPVIHKTKEGPALSGNKASYMYAPLDEVCKAIIPALGAVGISHSWKTSYEGEWMVVTCILTHEMGHSDSTTLRGCDDKGPGRNAIQAAGSTLTYLERYTLLAVCGIAVKGTDNDGASGPTMPDGWLDEQCEWLENASTQDELKKLFKNAYTEVSKVKDRKAMEVLIGVKDKRKGEL